MYIQIDVYHHHQMSPLPPAPSPCQVATIPPLEAGCKETQVLPTRAWLSGCLWAGNSCVSCWSGTGWLACPGESFSPWVRMTRVMGNAASAAALDLLRQLSKGGSTERDGERLLSVPQPAVFLRGFPQAAFQ